MTNHNDQFHMGRLPLKPYAFISAKTAVESDTGDGLSSQDELAVCKEFLIDYLSTEDHKATYDMYLVDPNDRTHFINLSEMIRTIAPLGDADKLTVTIEGDENAWTLKDIINFIYSRFVFPDTETEDYEALLENIFNNPDTINVLLKDVNNKIILPITTADNVYDKNGQNLQTKLDSITRIGFASTFVVAEESSNQFEFDFPFENYLQDGNYVEVRIGGTIINKSRYTIANESPTEDGLIPRKANIVFLDHPIEKGRTINFLFIYNAASDGSKYHIMSGANVAAGSLPSTALEKMSDSYIYPDSTSVASSKALYDLYIALMGAISTSQSIETFAVDSSTTATEISISLSNFTIKDGCCINVITKCNKNFGCKIKINGTPYTLYENNEDALSVPLPANKTIKIYYYDGKFYVKCANAHKLSANRKYYTAKDQEKEISYEGLAKSDNESEIFVYKNGIRLFEGIDYRLNRANSNITLFVRTESQDKIVFETLDVIDC